MIYYTVLNVKNIKIVQRCKEEKLVKSKIKLPPPQSKHKYAFFIFLR